MKSLIRGSLVYATKKGANIVEAYPIDPGYVTKYMNFTLSSGATENITATLNKTSGPGTPVPVIYYYFAAGVVGVIAAMAVAYVYIRKK